MTKIVLFEDSLVGELDPVATGRPAFGISVASYRLIDLLVELSYPIVAHVRDHLQQIVTEDWREIQQIFDFGSNSLPDDDDLLCLNARLAPTADNLKQLQKLVQQDGPWAIVDSQQVLAARISTDQARALFQVNFSPSDFVSQQTGIKSLDTSLDIVRHLHDLIRIHAKSMTGNLNHRIAKSNYTEIQDGIFSADASLKLTPHLAVCTKDGPIILESNIAIGPFTFLGGPIYLGPNCKVAEHSALKDGVSAGTTCKLGGEIECSIFESYTNKQHHGFLGHSHLGSWINLGAGTCNSDLKNTYGLVNMTRAGQKISTGMQFVGCFIGDYAKTAINSSIFTGKTLGVGSMAYGVVASDVAAFTNDARLMGKVTEIDAQVIVTTQARMFARRNREQRECDKQLILSMFKLTEADRTGLVKEPLVL